MKKLLTIITLVSALSSGGNEAYANRLTDWLRAKHPKVAVFFHLGPKQDDPKLVAAAAAGPQSVEELVNTKLAALGVPTTTTKSHGNDLELIWLLNNVVHGEEVLTQAQQANSGIEEAQEILATARARLNTYLLKAANPPVIPTPPQTPPPAEANKDEPEPVFTDAEVGPASPIVEALEIAADAQVEELDIAAEAQANINSNMPFLAFDREKYHLRNTPNEAFDNLTMAMEMLIPKIEAWCTAKGLSFYLSQPSLAVIDHNPAIVFSAYFVIVLLNVSHEQCTQQLQAATKWLEDYYAYPTSATAAIAVVSDPASAPSQNTVEQVSAQDAAADAFNIFLDEVKAAQLENEEFVTYLVIQALGDKIHQFLCTENTPKMAQEFFSTIDARVLWWWIYNMAQQMILPDETNNAKSWAYLLIQLQATTIQGFNIQGFNLLAEFDKQIETLPTSTAYKDGRIIFEKS